jgi:hypothetical protein
MAKWISKEKNGHFVPEWAREYLETVGPEVTQEKMRDIVEGQYALQKTAANLYNKPFVFQDTDLYSTLGYHRLWGGDSAQDLDLVERRAKTHKIRSIHCDE